MITFDSAIAINNSCCFYFLIHLCLFILDSAISPACAPATACHSEFQMAPIFPPMARRSGRQHIGNGGLSHAACSRACIREKRGMRKARGEEFEHHASAVIFCPTLVIFLDLLFLIILCTALSAWVDVSGTPPV